MTEESDDQVWRPSGKSCALPNDPKHLWRRLAELDVLTWPTLGEQIERSALVNWLNPLESNEITDTVVFNTACRISHVTQLSGHDALDSLYSTASGVWDELTYLADGRELDSPRPPIRKDDDLEQWASTRLAQGLDWFESIVGELKHLLDTHVISNPDIARFLEPRRPRIGEIFGGPLAIGASMYRLPTPWEGFGSGDEMLHVVDTLAMAVFSTTTDLDVINRTDEDEFRSALMSLDLFWQLLKGYIWAGVDEGLNGPLPGMLAGDPNTWAGSVWERAKDMLVRGRDALDATAVDGEHPAGFAQHGGQLSRDILGVPVEDLIRLMDDCIEQARRMQ